MFPHEGNSTTKLGIEEGISLLLIKRIGGLFIFWFRASPISLQEPLDNLNILICDAERPPHLLCCSGRSNVLHHDVKIPSIRNSAQVPKPQEPGSPAPSGEKDGGPAGLAAQCPRTQSSSGCQTSVSALGARKRSAWPKSAILADGGVRVMMRVVTSVLPRRVVV